MAGNSLSLVWDLIARDGASPVFDRVATSADKAAASTEAASAKVGGGFSSAAKVAGLAGAAFAAVSVKMAADFQSSTVRLVTSANESQRNLAKVQQGMLDLAGQVGYSTGELSKAMYKVESGGQHGAAGLAVLKAAAQGAKTENADLTTVADALTSAMTDYHLKASDAATVTSKLVAATASGKMTFEELAGSLAAILPVASANHVALNDVLGDLASMTMHGMSAEQASQNLADAIRHLAAPTQQQQKQFAALGLTTQQITADLGTKGLSGTINVIGDAIKAQMGPSTSRVILDLNTALSALPAPVKALGQGILDGTLSLGDYRKQMKALPAEQAIAAQSFMGLVSSTHQIGNETKNGAEVYQSYSGALRQALGDATGMNVALMIGGENAGNTAKAIANVSKATADAHGNVKGWSDIQGTFNQQIAEFGHSIEAAVTGFGMHLLPALTAGVGYINRDVIPAFKTVGSVVGDAAHWFGELPTPIKDVVGALAGLALANRIGILSGLGSGAGAVATAFKNVGESAVVSGAQIGGFGDEMALQQRLFQMEQAGLAGVDAAFVSAGAAADTYAASLTNVQRLQLGWDASLAESALAEDAQVASLGRMSAAMATVQARGMGALTAGMNGLKSAGSGLMSMFGGPWGLALAGAVVDVMLISQAEQKATEQEQQWTDALKKGGKAADEASAAMAKNAAQVNAIHSGWQGFGTSIASAIAPVDAMIPKAREAQKAFDDWYHSLTGVDRANEDVQLAQAKLNQVIDQYGPASAQAVTASENYQGAVARQKAAQDQLNSSEQTHLEKLQAIAQKELDSVNSSLAAQQAHLSFDAALQQLNADTKDGQHNQAQLNQEQLGLAQSALGWAQSAGEAAAAQAKANGVTDTASAANKAQLDVLQQVAAQMGTATPQSIRDAIKALSDATASTDNLSKAVSDMGLTNVNEGGRFRAEWGNNVQVLHGATQAQIKDLQGLGYTVLNLPDGDILVSADTRAARNAISQLSNDYASYSINVGLKIGSSIFARAAGGPIYGPGSGTSDSIPAMLSNGEWVIKAASVAKYGHKAMAAVNSGHADIVPRFAAGGPVNDMYLTANVGIAPASLSAAGQAIQGQVSSMMAGATSGGAGGAARWAGVVLQALAMMHQPASLLGTVLRRMNQESGGNPNAINLWDSNAARGYPSQGLMQTIPSTFAAYHYPGTSYNIDDPLANVLASMRYALARYGSLSAAYNKVGGYKLGTNYVPSDQLALLHKGEAVVPASQNQGAPFQSNPTVQFNYNGPVITHDPDELVWKQRVATQRVMQSLGVKIR